jgi:CubicO group peptidase (beta-lactamase class C family)
MRGDEGEATRQYLAARLGRQKFIFVEEFARAQRPAGDPMRSFLGLAFTAFLSAVLALGANADPVGHWENADPTEGGLSGEGLKAVQDYGGALNPTAIMIVRDGRVIASWGDVSRKVDVASVRKSLLSALYGVAASEGRINLASTLAQLGIDDKPPSLTEVEKQATVRDLLMARSGVYHHAAHETAEMKENRPERGSHPPGSFWFYNNWDFNVLGAIYRKATGEDIFQSFAQRIARPIGMEDFTGEDGRYVFSRSSLYPAYLFSLSTRDLARFGLLYLNGGRWRGKQVIPAAWVKESTAPYSQTDRPGRGYGYLWWTLTAAEWGDGAILASGFGGQLMAVIPAKRLVMAQTMESRQNAKEGLTKNFLDLLRKVAASP